MKLSKDVKYIATILLLDMVLFAVSCFTFINAVINSETKIEGGNIYAEESIGKNIMGIDNNI